MVLLGTYSIYVNHVRHRVVIHYSTCNRLAQRGGVPAAPRRQYYITGLIDLDEARELADDIVYERERCSWCGAETV